jgi:nucleotidyltransferase/DNA polymerase involved in DNA repair
VDARTARMGDGLSTYRDGVISACNAPARERGVEVGQPAAVAADLLLGGQGNTERRGDGDGRG